jgi:hypothetical protein
MPGPGYGGSCFPKDTLALVRTAEEAGAPTTLVDATVRANDRRKAAMADKISGGARRRTVRRDGRDPGRHLQAEHGRHARQPGARHHPGPASGRARP